jgi:ACR3 family arsenite efflux pump ArsB
MGWMPRGVSWLRTIILIGITAATVSSLKLLTPYGYESRHPWFFVVMVLIGSVLPFIAYAYIHSWMIGKKPERWSKKIPVPASIKEAVLSFVVMVFGMVATLIVTIPFAPDPTRYSYQYQDSARFVQIATLAWFVVTIYMFHGYDIINNPHDNKAVKDAKPKPKVDASIDLELNRLKHQTGINLKEPPK